MAKLAKSVGISNETINELPLLPPTSNDGDSCIRNAPVNLEQREEFKKSKLDLDRVNSDVGFALLLLPEEISIDAWILSIPVEGA